MLSNNHLPADVDRVKQFLTRYLEATGMALEFSAEAAPAAPPGTEDSVLHVHFSGPDVPLLLDRNADLLNSLEHLAAKLLGLSPEQHHRIRFDAAGYKSGRENELEAAARQAIAEVTESGYAFRLPPMNSRERRVLHILAAEAGLRSASTGEGPFRSVTIYPATDPDANPDPKGPAPATDARTARLRQSFRRR